MSFIALSACNTERVPLGATDSYCDIYQVIEYPVEILNTDNKNHRQEICELFRNIDRENCVFVATCDPVRYITPDKNGRTIQEYCKSKKTCK